MGIAKHTGECAHGEHFFKSTTENLLRCAQLSVGMVDMLVKEDVLSLKI